MDREWVHRSACRGLDPIIFYPATDDEADAAKSVCTQCPVQLACLEHAIGNREHNGVWGGATERERQRIIRRRRRVRATGGGLDSPAIGDQLSPGDGLGEAGIAMINAIASGAVAR